MTHPLLYGFTVGGYTDPHPTFTADSDRITFSTGVGAAHTDSNVSTTRGNMGNVSDYTTYGYYVGGGNDVITDRMTFATSVVAAHTDSNCVLNCANDQGCSGQLYGFIIGWTSQYGSHETPAQRMTFATGVVALHTDADATGSFGRNHPATLSDASPN
jgi:hypothetical protein